MVDITEKTRLETYKHASDSVRALYANDTLGQLYLQTADAYHLDEEKEQILADCFGDAILGIYPTEQIGDALIQKRVLSFSDTQAVLAEYDAWIEKIKDLHRASADLFPPKNTPSEIDAQNISSPPPDPSRPLTREDVMQALAQKRTMQGDINSARNQSSDGAAGPRG